MPQVTRQHLASWAKEIIADATSKWVGSDCRVAGEFESKGTYNAVTIGWIPCRDTGVPAAAPVPDITVNDYGTIVGLTPQNDAARVWLEENLDADRAVLGSTYCIDHRHLEPIVCYAIADGLVVAAA
jgi:hypothetical protein